MNEVTELKTWTDCELAPALTRELARRLTGGVEVALLWHVGIDSLSVSVRDAGGGVDFWLEVEAGKAMDVFHHPYAYAARRGIEYGPQDEAETVDV